MKYSLYTREMFIKLYAKLRVSTSINISFGRETAIKLHQYLTFII